MDEDIAASFIIGLAVGAVAILGAPISPLFIYGIRIHHLLIGIFIIATASFYNNFVGGINGKFKWFLYGFGALLIVDQLPNLIQQNFSDGISLVSRLK